MNVLRKMGRWLALGAMLLVGLAASVFIAACGGRGEKKPTPESPKPPKQEVPKPAPPATAAPADKEPPKAKVDRKEVEKGQPLPRNYLE